MLLLLLLLLLVRDAVEALIDGVFTIVPGRRRVASGGNAPLTVYQSCPDRRFSPSQLLHTVYTTLTICRGSTLDMFFTTARVFQCRKIIIRKISKIGDIKCQMLRLKCTKFDFRRGATPDVAWEAYSVPPDSCI